ncbi:hypothetical protein B0T17DRAFT_511693 [Bombardia bombarda]|uniref:Uncharacterized protein n=1 Tax=Bombardia bombarda TaxID=252184 RepID=A0AA39WD10_9PEZI|nr:hypothetical protein B0T17DRAFT_511693 [Bombardia bombarda]
MADPIIFMYDIPSVTYTGVDETAPPQYDVDGIELIPLNPIILFASPTASEFLGGDSSLFPRTDEGRYRAAIERADERVAYLMFDGRLRENWAVAVSVRHPLLQPDYQVSRVEGYKHENQLADLKSGHAKKGRGGGGLGNFYRQLPANVYLPGRGLCQWQVVVGFDETGLQAVLSSARALVKDEESGAVAVEVWRAGRLDPGEALLDRGLRRWRFEGRRVYWGDDRRDMSRGMEMRWVREDCMYSCVMGEEGRIDRDDEEEEESVTG